MKKILLSLFAVLILLLPTFCLAYEGGDTGTYRILAYRVTLAPRRDGSAAIAYYQKWRVTGGHIPWITVGVPNEDHEITSNSMAAQSASSQGDGLVRLDLDKDYQAGQEFEIQFSINEQRLFSSDGSNYRLDFTPGWYDRAATDLLEIRYQPFASITNVSISPEPTSSSDQEIMWSRSGLAEGERFPISISFPVSSVAQPMATTGSKSDGSAPDWVLITIGVVAFLGIGAYIIHWLSTNPDGRYLDGGSISGGTYHSGYYGTGFHCACACACAGCACACACAGGGGAGCSRKTEHICAACRVKSEKEENESCPLYTA